VAVSQQSGSPRGGSLEQTVQQVDGRPCQDTATRDRVGHAARCRCIARVLVISIVLALAAGNALIGVATIWAKANGPNSARPRLPGIDNLAAVDNRLWRGAAPSREGYEALASRGVKTIIDLRAESHEGVEPAMVERLGMELLRIPVRDGQAPSSEEVRKFLSAVAASDGRVFVHCGAGVGRSGTMAAAYLVQNGEATSTEALALNLAVGPPSLEQVSFVSEMGDGSFDEPSLPVTALSRFLDAPRRLFARLDL
jgi:protein-tyrosine phosphatase